MLCADGANRWHDDYLIEVDAKDEPQAGALDNAGFADMTVY